MTEQNIQTYRVTGMDCADCAKTIERGIAKFSGVTGCALNYTSATLKVTGPVARADVISRVTALGYGVRSNQTAPMAQQSTWQQFLARLPATGPAGFLKFLLSRANTALAFLGLLLVLPGLVFHELLPALGYRGLWLDGTAIAALLVAGIPIARSAWRSLRISHEIGINMLMTIAAIGAVIIGAYTEAGLVMVLFSVGEALEGYTTERARESIQKLLQVAPGEATVLRACNDCTEHLAQDGYTGGPCPLCGIEETRVFVDELRVGETIVVKPGERIAMDGRILTGLSAVNQAPITGESVPVDKEPGNNVFAGTINGEGVLEIQISQLAQDSMLNRIIRMVEDAQEHKAPAERFVDTFAKYYTPAVVVLAALVAAIPPLIFAQSFLGSQGWLYRALELLVVACPCALVISTPVSFISAISNAARNGVLIKGGAYLEALSTVKAIAFDKTGTLTEGAPAVIQIKSIDCTTPVTGDCDNCATLVDMASAVERRSEHPLARAIVAAAETSSAGSRLPPALAITALPGQGITGQVAGQTVVIGSHAYFETVMPHGQAVCDALDLAATKGETPMLIGVDGRYMGYITVADTVRPASRAAIADLRASGIAATVMLTGDNAATAAVVAQQAGVTEVRAGLLPQDKVAAVKELLAKYGSVAMVGDGINDAPAIATATVGIAMGAGSAQALETADVALMGNDLGKLAYAIHLARTAMRTIRGNILFAIGIKVAFLVLVLVGLGSMSLAVLADVGASLLVTLNGMRLLGYQRKLPAAG